MSTPETYLVLHFAELNPVERREVLNLVLNAIEDIPQFKGSKYWGELFQAVPATGDDDDDDDDDNSLGRAVVE